MKESDVPGTYHQRHPYGVETLTLEPGGTYQEEFIFDSGHSLGNSGRWELWTSAGGDVMVRVYDGVIAPLPEQLLSVLRPKPKFDYTFRARESRRGKVLEMIPDSEGQVRLTRLP